MKLTKKVIMVALFAIIGILSCTKDKAGVDIPTGTDNPTDGGGDGGNGGGDGSTGIPNFTVRGDAAQICNAKGNGKLYEVGPGKEYEKIIDIPTENLGPGDAIRIYAKDEPYYERIVITTKGTEQAPICVCGVPDASGKLPILDGTNARVRPVDIHPYFNSNTAYSAVILVFGSNDNHPEYVNISNLQIQGAHQFNEDDTQKTYKMGTDELIPYGRAAAGISLRGKHFDIFNCVIRYNGNGIFGAYSGSDEPLVNVTLSNNIIQDNGTFNVDRQHNVYIESEGLVSIGNQFGPIREGSRGVNYKSRSAGDIILYNRFVGPAGRQINLAEAENSVDYFPQLDSFKKTYVAGNIIEGSTNGASSILHYGHDVNNASADERGKRSGDLYAYNNTFVLKGDASSSYRRLFFDVTFCEGKLHAFNNVLYYENNTGVDSEISIMRDRGSVLNFSNNLITSATRAAYVTRIPQNEQLNICSPNTLLLAPTVQDMMVPNQDFGLDANNMYRLTNNSKAIDAGIEIPSNLPKVDYQFKLPNGVETRSVNGSGIDIGAFEF